MRPTGYFERKALSYYGIYNGAFNTAAKKPHEIYDHSTGKRLLDEHTPGAVEYEMPVLNNWTGNIVIRNRK